MALNTRLRRGEPFASLEPTTEPKEIESRDQIASAIILYRLLCAEMDSEEARAIVGDVVEAAAHIFLAQNIGPIGASQLDSLSDEERVHFVETRLDKFPNTLVQIDEVRSNRVRFQVEKCRFVRLCSAVGVPELMPVFCAVDASYFGQVQPGVELIRPTTLAKGDSTCDFTLVVEQSVD